jgi:hypothetical protein
MLDEQRAAYEQHIRALVDFGHRGSTTDRERAAADYLCDQLKSIGLDPEREAFRGSSSYGGRILVHVLFAAVGAAAFWSFPLLGICLGLIVLVSLWVESTTRGVWLSRLLVRSPSTNVIARIPATAPRLRVIVSGHYDTQRTGYIWWLGTFLIPLFWCIPAFLKPPLLSLGIAIITQLLLSSLAIAIGESDLLTIANWSVCGVYAIYIVFLGDWAWGRFVPGAADNATGAAAVLAVGKAWCSRPVGGVELVLLLPGCEEAGVIGSAAWADRHRSELEALPTFFLNFDNLGVGSVKFFGSEIPLFGWPIAYPRAMVELAKEAADRIGLENAGPHSMPGPTDGLSFLVRGLPGVTIVSFRKWGYMPWYHRLGDTAEHLDFDAAWQGVLFGWTWLEYLLTSKEIDSFCATGKCIQPPDPGTF